MIVSIELNNAIMNAIIGCELKLLASRYNPSMNMIVMAIANAVVFLQT